jgi:hypothetical protein
MNASLEVEDDGGIAHKRQHMRDGVITPTDVIDLEDE